MNGTNSLLLITEAVGVRVTWPKHMFVIISYCERPLFDINSFINVCVGFFRQTNQNINIRIDKTVHHFSFSNNFEH